MVDNYHHIQSKTISFLERQLKNRLDISNQVINTQIIERYLSCFNLDKLPSENFLSDYLFQENPSMAAISCEFYGGIFYQHIDSRKTMKNLHDFEMGLSIAYHILSQHYNSLLSVEDKTKQILAAFRQTTDYLRYEEGVITPLHN